MRENTPKSYNTWNVKVSDAHPSGGRGSKGSLQRREFSNAFIARFFTKYSQSSGCWLWQAGCTPRGYGMVNLGRLADGTQQTTYAHRVAYVLAHGDIPAGMVVMHSCDTPACVNPAHLSLGTQADNVSDGVRKGHYRLAGARRRKVA